MKGLACGGMLQTDFSHRNPLPAAAGWELVAQTTAGAACDVLFQQIKEGSSWLRPEVEEPGWTKRERGDPEFLANQQLTDSLEYRCP